MIPVPDQARPDARPLTDGQPDWSPVHHAFETLATEHPDRPAVAFENGITTYGELNGRAKQLAWHLQDLGVGAETRVGICLERSVGMLECLFAVLKAGGAYVPIDPLYPPERIGHVIQESAADLVLTAGNVRQRDFRDARVVDIDACRTRISSYPVTRPVADVRPENLAYVIFTSGSTGRAKGVMVEHGSLASSTLARVHFYGRPAHRYLLLSSFAFDSSVAGIFWTLCQGGTLILPGTGAERDVPAVLRLIESEGVSHVLCLPALYQLIAEQARTGDLRSLETVIVAGESVPAGLAELHRQAAPECRLFNEYGPTEATVWATACEITNQAADAPVPIGQPIGRSTVYVLGPDGEIVPPGIAGELHIGGPGVARGYIHQPDLTAERFIPCSFTEGPGARMYRTGDLARARSDGNLEFLGRIDRQVKIRGYRVELAEIEDAIGRHPDVQSSAVVLREDTPGQKKLVAYLVWRAGASTSIRAVRQALLDRLPEWMVPTSFELLESLPLNPNGKVDRNSLPAPSRRRPDLEEPAVRPRNALEEFIRGIWSRELGFDEIGVHDRFFELGGDSLQAVRIVNCLQAELREPLFVTTIFDAPTVASYSAFLEKHYPQALSGRLGLQPRPPASGVNESRPVRRYIDENAIADFRSRIPTLPPQSPQNVPAGTKNPPAIFILAPPRSGTTLLRVILAGHPAVFAAPELHLLNFADLGERRRALSGRQSIWRDGLLRTIREIRQCSAEAAQQILAPLEDQCCPVRDVYALLQEWIRPKTLLDKTPAYALCKESLLRAEEYFEGAVYVHLVRHPGAMVRSFVEKRMDQVFLPFEHPYAARDQAELVWVVSHRNISEFLKGVSPSRQCTMRYEDLTVEPERELRRLCDSTGLDFHANMLKPYEDLDAKMVDGLHAESTPMGDPHFLRFTGIEPTPVPVWTGASDADSLSRLTWDLAETFGYPASGNEQDRQRQMRLSRRGSPRPAGSRHG